MKKKIPIITAVVAVGIAVTVLLTGAFPSTKSSTLSVKVTALTPTDLSNSISVTGVVESLEKKSVYSTLNYTVETVHVEVGDKVEAGDILCELDTSDLQTSISQKQASISSSTASAQLKLEIAQKNLKNAQGNVDNDYNSQLLSAESSVRNAEASVRSAEESLTSAETDLAIAIKNYKNASDENEDGDEYGEEIYTKSQMESYRSNITKARQTVEQAENKLADAREDLEAAKASYNATKNSIDQELDGYSDDIKSAQLALNMDTDYIELQKLQKDLQEAVITAPISGTVTAVYAKEGSSGSGLLFVIEDTENLKISTTIKEYDITSVSLGDRVTIKTDATGDAIYEGKLNKIAPTTLKDTSGDTTETTNAEFESEVLVDSGASDLRIGMNARLSVIYEEVQGVYAVSFDSVTTNADGETIVYIARPQEDGTYKAESMPVRTGMETDFYTQIISEYLHDGDMVINDPEGISDGLVIEVSHAGQGGGQKTGGSGARTGNGGGSGGMVIMGGPGFGG